MEYALMPKLQYFDVEVNRLNGVPCDACKSFGKE